MNNKKLKYIFVGGFQETAKDGSVGGQVFACRSLINSPISNYVDWYTLDTTLESYPVPPLYRRFLFAVKRIIKYVSLLFSNEVDGVLIFTSAHYSFYEKGLMVIMARLFSKRVVLSPRSGLILNDLNRSYITKWYITKVLQLSDMIICQSESWKELYKKISKLHENRFTVIYNWIDIPDLLKSNNVKYSSPEFKILFMGWINNNKGIYDLVDAINEIRSKLEPFKIIICGKGPEEENIKLKIKLLNLTENFKFLGWVTGKDKINAFHEADIFVLPSYKEGLPNALLEAMAYGIPVIASGVGAIPEVVQNEFNGMLIQPGDVSGLSKAILRLEQDKELRERMGENARKKIILDHDILINWEKILKTLDDRMEIAQ